MAGWIIAVIIVFILGVLISNAMQLAKLQVPESVLRAIQEKKDKALREKEQQEKPKEK